MKPEEEEIHPNCKKKLTFMNVEQPLKFLGSHETTQNKYKIE